MNLLNKLFDIKLENFNISKILDILIMNALYERLRNVKSIARCLLYCLEYTDENPQDIGVVGAAWIDDKRIFLHTNTFAEFTHKKNGTINRYLKEHTFECSRLSKSDQSMIINHFELQQDFVGKGTMRKSNVFNKSNAAFVVDNLPYKGSKEKEKNQTVTGNGNIQNANNNKSDDHSFDMQSENDFSPPIEPFNYDDEQTAFYDECYRNFDDYDYLF